MNEVILGLPKILRRQVADLEPTDAAVQLLVWPAGVSARCSPESDPIFLGHGRQHPNHHRSGTSPAWRLDPHAQLFQLISQAVGLQLMQTQGSSSSTLSTNMPEALPRNLRTAQTQPTVGIEWVGSEPLQEIASGKSEIPIVQGVPALFEDGAEAVAA